MEGSFSGGFLYQRVPLSEGPFIGGYLYQRVPLSEGPFIRGIDGSLYWRVPLSVGPFIRGFLYRRVPLSEVSMGPFIGGSFIGGSFIGGSLYLWVLLSEGPLSKVLHHVVIIVGTILHGEILIHSIW